MGWAKSRIDLVEMLLIVSKQMKSGEDLGREAKAHVSNIFIITIVSYRGRYSLVLSAS